ncbi:unnamed protein product [Mytilus coruscus]|uniref:DDE Tnp4 domain-containing protein n=1 Tax=Mytilus coruscus TaxID=42192 RepID=A0A6J8BQX0_MYTCO|nr:unnamed protein product [Mytilus coruscus]
MNEQQRRSFMVILMTYMRYKSLTACPPPLFNANDDMYFLILLQNFRQYLISRRRPPILYNFSIRSRILDNADGDEFIVNDVYAVVIQRPYEFWILTGESTTSFQNIVIDVSQNLNLHGKEITSVQNRILLTLIWLRQYPTYTLLSMSFGIRFLGHDNDANAYHRIGPIGPGDALDFPPQCYILADSIYPNGYPLVTPFKSVEIIRQTRAEKRFRRKFNILHRNRRVYVEHVIKEIKTFKVIGSLFRHPRWKLSSIVELCAGLAKRRADLLSGELA